MHFIMNYQATFGRRKTDLAPIEIYELIEKDD